MKKCKYCGAAVEDGAKTCTQCGGAEFLHICANCGNTFEGGMHCPMCGVKVGKEKKKCPRCGEEYFSPACPSCGYKPSSGVAFFDSGFSTSFAGGGAVRTGPATVGRFNKWVAFFLCLFFGLWGIHKFYEGKIVLGIVYLFTFGIFGIGALIDLIVLLGKPTYYN